MTTTAELSAATQQYADDNGANNSNSTVVTLTDDTPPPTGMHVGDLWKLSTSEGRTWSAYVIVTVHDGSHNPLPNAIVYGSWTGTGIGSDECTTDYAGECLMLKTFIRRRTRQVRFSVTNVVHASLTYESGANHDADGDSDGTSITILKP
jgi:serine protease AprX